MGRYGEVRFDNRDVLEKHEDAILDKLDDFGCELTYCPGESKVELRRLGGYSITDSDIDEINAAMKEYGGKIEVS